MRYLETVGDIIASGKNTILVRGDNKFVKISFEKDHVVILYERASTLNENIAINVKVLLKKLLSSRQLAYISLRLRDRSRLDFCIEYAPRFLLRKIVEKISRFSKDRCVAYDIQLKYSHSVIVQDLFYIIQLCNYYGTDVVLDTGGLIYVNPDRELLWRITENLLNK